mmetsp:Transcript_9259/g.31752  ORF Transcript_9259/g.31752 Transcript_9259/m.31752 type:complete len:296 (-) Transcript_9259:822-1709(-)
MHSVRRSAGSSSPLMTDTVTHVLPGRACAKHAALQMRKLERSGNPRIASRREPLENVSFDPAMHGPLSSVNWLASVRRAAASRSSANLSDTRNTEFFRTSSGRRVVAPPAASSKVRSARSTCDVARSASSTSKNLVATDPRGPTHTMSRHRRAPAPSCRTALTSHVSTKWNRRETWESSATLIGAAASPTTAGAPPSVATVIASCGSSAPLRPGFMRRRRSSTARLGSAGPFRSDSSLKFSQISRSSRADLSSASAVRVAIVGLASTTEVPLRSRTVTSMSVCGSMRPGSFTSRQ